MKNFQIIPVPGNDENLKQSLHVRNNNKDFAIIFSDATITFNPQMDYLLEDLDYLIKIGSMFYTFYNNLKTT